MPRFDIAHMESPPNPLGVKGAGEGGIIPVAAAAVEDALEPFGVVIRELPIEPARLVATIRGDA